MAHQARNGHHDESYADMSHYAAFNQMPFNFQQRQAFSPQAVLSQNDANYMDQFFANPESTNPNDSILPYGMDGKVDFGVMPDNPNSNNNNNNNNNSHNHSNLSMNANHMMPNPTASPHQPSHPHLSSHLSQPSSRPPFASIDFSEVYLPPHQPANQSAGGDDVAGASALMGLSSSQDAQNPLNASNYASWGNIVATPLIHTPNNTQNSAHPSNRDRPAPATNGTPQPHQSMPTPQNQQISWSGPANPHSQPRTRHPSLQLDTGSTVANHNQAWQQGPQSAFPHAAAAVRSRPPIYRFGSDDAFSPSGFQGSHPSIPEDKQNNLLHLGFDPLRGGTFQPMPHARAFRPIGQQHAYPRHSMPNVKANLASPQSSPGGRGGLPSHQASNGWPGVNPQAPQNPANHSRKRRASQLNETVSPHAARLPQSGQIPDTTDGAEETRPASAVNKRRRSNAQGTAFSSHSASSPSSSQTSPLTGSAALPSSAAAAAAANAARARRAAREPKQPRQNLTDAQKRSNHIASEQKRRDAMKTNFDDLNTLVPSLHLGSSGLSRSEILQHAAIFLEELKAGNAVVAEEAHITFDIIDREIGHLDDGADDDDDDDEEEDAE